MIKARLAGVKILGARTELTPVGHPMTAAVAPSWAPGTMRWCHLELPGLTPGHMRLRSPWAPTLYWAVPPASFLLGLAPLTLISVGQMCLWARMTFCIPLAV